MNPEEKQRLVDDALRQLKAQGISGPKEATDIEQLLILARHKLSVIVDHAKWLSSQGRLAGKEVERKVIMEAIHMDLLNAFHEYDKDQLLVLFTQHAMQVVLAKVM